jgi:hypothetical protein
VLTDKHKELLDSGFVYIHGRDRSLRPIMICNNYKLTKLSIKDEDAVNMMRFVGIQYLEHIFVSGKIENTIAVSDYDQCGLTNMPK